MSPPTRILMLGWEYPPHITGGLGTACEGLARALGRTGVDLTMAVPHLQGGERVGLFTLVDATRGRYITHDHVVASDDGFRDEIDEIDPVLALALGPPSTHLSSYTSPSGSGAGRFRELFARTAANAHNAPPETLTELRETLIARARSLAKELRKNSSLDSHYGSSIFDEVDLFAANVLVRFGRESFDAIHAHDWMSFPAAVALQQALNIPLVVHVHSLEFDRSGANVNEQIHFIERMGLQAADRVIAVSYYTQRLIHDQHGIPLEKMIVVHNGVYPKKAVQGYRRSLGWNGPVVLFLGRITFQKGPDYFVEAAAHVKKQIRDVQFVMAGTGDMLPRIHDRVRELGLRDSFHFPGFLRGSEVEEMFSVADCYVMPSVSEPFGISALEAISHDTPVIISRQSGVSEVLRHALKVDFWDVHRMADLMVSTLMYKELRAEMVASAHREIEQLRWESSALRVIELYRHLTTTTQHSGYSV